MNMISEAEAFDESPQKRWSKRITKGDVTKEITVEKAENGYIIELCVWGDFPKGDGEGKEYKHKQKKILSDKNPLAEQDVEDEWDKSVKAMEELVSNSINFEEA